MGDSPAAIRSTDLDGDGILDELGLDDLRDRGFKAVFLGLGAHKGKGLGIAILDTGQDADHAGSKRPHACYYPGGNPNNTTGRSTITTGRST